jgi:hypothetical protein
LAGRGFHAGFKKSAEGSPQVRSEDEIAERCAGTTGTWCRDFYTQKPIPSKVAPGFRGAEMSGRGEQGVVVGTSGTVGVSRGLVGGGGGGKRGGKVGGAGEGRGERGEVRGEQREGRGQQREGYGKDWER